MKRRLYQLAIIVVSLFVIQGLSRSLIDLNKQKNRTRDAEKELQDLQKQKADLEAELKYYQSDEYVEKIARDKLMLGKEGETVLILPQDENKPISTNNPINQSAPTTEKKSLWQKIVGIFKK